jgi:hypothetical protein
MSSKILGKAVQIQRLLSRCSVASLLSWFKIQSTGLKPFAIISSLVHVFSLLRTILPFIAGSRNWHMKLAHCFTTDVHKLDHQDDNTAAHLFSATTIEFLIKYHPDYLGEIIYLFIFGELIDAYQNQALAP